MLDSSFEGKLFINKILQYNKNVYSLDDYNVEEWSLYKTSGQFFSSQITLNTSKIVPFGKLYKMIFLFWGFLVQEANKENGHCKWN